MIRMFCLLEFGIVQSPAEGASTRSGSAFCGLDAHRVGSCCFVCR